MPNASAYNVTGLIVIKIRAVADAGKCRVGMYAIFVRDVRHPRRVSSRSRRGIGSIFFGGVFMGGRQMAVPAVIGLIDVV